MKRNHDVVASAAPPIIARIPGNWNDRAELAAALSNGYVLDDRGLRTPVDNLVGLQLVPRDAMFPGVFASGVHPPIDQATRDDLEATTSLACILTPGGTCDLLEMAIDAITALLDAGGLGVFVDNSGATCLASDWGEYVGSGIELALATLVTRVRSAKEIFSIGMHMTGHPDAVIERGDDDARDLFELGCFLEYMLAPHGPIDNGDIVGSEEGPRYQVWKEKVRFPAHGSPMHNPFGRWRLDRMTKASGGY